MSIAIVAIPPRDDYIWQLSSEKVPHLTLLALGDTLDNQSEVESFIAHAVDTSLSKFSLVVDSRGVLGPQSADVLFFGKYCLNQLTNFRSYLLGDVNIRRSYDSIEQFPEWVPHLTMGFPATPAKPDNRDFPGTYSVGFDRIALWTGDSEGVEFPLKTDSTNDLFMSNAGKNFLEHFGVKGMKWGVRNSEMGGGSSSAVAVSAKPGKMVKTTGGKHHAPHEDAVKVAISKQKARKSSTDSLSNRELQDLVNRLNMEQQYSRLIATHPGSSSDVQKFLKKAQVVGKTVNDVHTFLNSPAGKVAKAALKAKLGR